MVGRARRGLHAPVAEHVAVPATDAGGDVALPDAEAAELLRHVEQLGQALRTRGPLVVLGGVAQGPEPVVADTGDAGPHPQRCARGGTQGELGIRIGAATQHVREHGARAQAGGALEGLVAPAQAAGLVGQREQVVALRQPGGEQRLGRWRGRCVRCAHGAAGCSARNRPAQSRACSYYGRQCDPFPKGCSQTGRARRCKPSPRPAPAAVCALLTACLAATHCRP